MSRLNRIQINALQQLYHEVDQQMIIINNAIDAVQQANRGQVIQQQGRVSKKKKRTMYCRDWLLARPIMGQFKLLMDELRLNDVRSFKNFTRMEPEIFFPLLQRLRPRIKKKRTFFKKPISAGCRLAIALRYYASGDAYKSMTYSWYVAHNTISKIVREVSEAIIAEFSEELLKPPTDQEGWRKIADKFASRWNFPHAIGALDGKHIAIQRPHKSGSMYYNYKHFYSVILLALVDADYRFIWVDAGTNGHCSDAQIWNDCELQDAIKKNVLGLPPPEPLEGEDFELPYFIVGDEAFALRTYLMKPYGKRGLNREERLFNYRLSRARRIVENAFGILSQRFRCFLGTMRQTPQTVTSVLLACCCLHNLLRMNEPNAARGIVDEEDDNHELVPGVWRENNLLDPYIDPDLNRCTKVALKQREYLKNYVTSPRGAVEWQNRMVPL